MPNIGHRPTKHRRAHGRPELKSDKPLVTHDGLTWMDMPGECHENKKLNFTLFRMGKLSREYVTCTVKERANHNIKTRAPRHRSKRSALLDVVYGED